MAATDDRERADFSSVVVLWSADQALIEELALELGRRDPSVELHVVPNVGVLAQHIGAIRPDAVIVDIDTTHDFAPTLASPGVLARVPTILLGVDAQSVAAMLPDGARPVDYVDRRGAYVESVANALALVQRTVGLADRMQETVRHYRDILEASSDGIFVLVGGVFMYVNPTFSSRVGKPTAELLGKTELVALAHPDDRHLLAEELARVAVADGRPELIETRLLDPQSRPRRFEIAARASVLEGQRAIVGIARDVTAVLEMQDEIDRARARAAQIERLRALGELAAGVAHDFNNMLETVLGRVELARGRLKRGESADEDLAIIQAAAKDAAATVQRIQEFARPSGGDTWYDVDLAAVVRDAAEFIRTRIPKLVQLHLEVRQTPLVRGNGAELREVVSNLLTNALDAIDGAGAVTLSAYGEQGQAVIEVADTGRGMSPDVQRRIFEPFFSTKGATGTGLGLSVAHGILRRHDAQIHLESEPGRGTRFRLVFAPAEPTAKRSLKAAQASLRIVVCDDDPAVAALIKDLLEEMGHQVALAHSVGETLKLVAERPIDVLLTDLDLPEMSGWQLARNVRRIQPKVTVGLVTGWPLGASDAELRARGVDFALSKPFSLEMLRNALARPPIGKA